MLMEVHVYLPEAVIAQKRAEINIDARLDLKASLQHEILSIEEQSTSPEDDCVGKKPSLSP
jgi:hypothetical protein